MRTILLIVSFLIIIFTFIIFYIGIYDEIYQKLEKDKWTVHMIDVYGVYIK